MRQVRIAKINIGQMRALQIGLPDAEARKIVAPHIDAEMRSRLRILPAA